jgi:hypothetical protein
VKVETPEEKELVEVESAPIEVAETYEVPQVGSRITLTIEGEVSLSSQYSDQIQVRVDYGGRVSWLTVPVSVVVDK